MIEAALAFLHAGYSVVPASISGSKAPLGQWKRYQSAQADEAQLHAWFDGGHPGIGVVCGAVSGNLEMLEFEGRAVDEGVLDAFITALVSSGQAYLLKQVLSGYVEMSPSGGYHLHYRLDSEVPGNTKLASRQAREDELTDDERAVMQRTGRTPPRVLIETRGEGGFVVTAPSHGTVHPSGRAWLVVAGSPATTPVLSLADRDVLAECARSLNTYTEPERPAIPPRPAIPLPDGELRPGDEFNLRAEWRDILEPHGWVIESYGHGDQVYWSRPGKRPSEGKSAVTGGDNGDRFYCWTTSTEFPSEQAIDKFGVYAILEHRGDLASATRELRRLDYGTPLPDQYRHSTQDVSDWNILTASTGKPAAGVDQPALEAMLTAIEPSVDAVELLMSKMLTIDQLASRPRPRPLIDGLMDSGKLAIVYGSPGSLKSFIVLDMLACISNGIGWHGRTVQKAHTLYVAAEGGYDVDKRLEAWEHHYGRTSLVRVLPQPIDLFHGTEVDTLVEAIRRMEIGVVAFDTFNRCAPGLEENSAKDTGIALHYIQRITSIGVTVMLVHHTPRDGTNPRGSTALEGATDHGIRVDRPSRHVMTVDVVNERQKDHPDGQIMKFKGLVIDQVDSLVMVDSDFTTTVSVADDVEYAVLEYVIRKGPISKREIVRASLGVGRNAEKGDALAILLERGYVESVGTTTTLVGSKAKAGGADQFEATDVGREHARLRLQETIMGAKQE